MELTTEEMQVLAWLLTGQAITAADRGALTELTERLTDALADLAAWQDDNRAEGN